MYAANVNTPEIKLFWTVEVGLKYCVIHKL